MVQGPGNTASAQTEYSMSKITCSKTHFVLENRKFSSSQGSVALYGCKSDVAAVLPGNLE